MQQRRKRGRPAKIRAVEVPELYRTLWHALSAIHSYEKLIAQGAQPSKELLEFLASLERAKTTWLEMPVREHEVGETPPRLALYSKYRKPLAKIFWKRLGRRGKKFKNQREYIDAVRELFSADRSTIGEDFEQVVNKVAWDKLDIERRGDPSQAAPEALAVVLGNCSRRQADDLLKAINRKPADTGPGIFLLYGFLLEPLEKFLRMQIPYELVDETMKVLRDNFWTS